MLKQVIINENESEPMARAAMRPLNYEVMFDVEDSHWWFVGRRSIVFTQIEDALRAGLETREESRARRSTDELSAAPAQAASSAIPGLRILDIGCGTGATMDHLQRYGQPHGIDLSELPLRFSRRRGHQRTLRASATELPFDSDSFDLVTALDVIEHLNDDLKGMAEIRRVLRPGAPAIIFVPAFQSLWGPNDVQSGHKRRYRLEELAAVVREAGLRIERISYANFAMFLPIWLGRKILNALGRDEQAENRINHPIINNLLAKIFSCEAGWLRRRSLPFGVSIICVARKIA
jgi:ubiquinone/menaquinone biosynthesis C-methylase UbiE